MTERAKLKAAKKEFSTLCEIFKEKKWKFEKDKDELKVSGQTQGEDLPIDFTFHIIPETQTIIFFSHIPFSVPEDKRVDFSIVVSAVNDLFVEGCFDYNITNGRIGFRMTNSFLGISLNKELYLAMFLCAAFTIDEYNDKFLMLAKGLITTEQFIEQINK